MRGMHSDEHLVRSYRGRLDVRELKYLRRSVLVLCDRPHRAPVVAAAGHYAAPEVDLSEGDVVIGGE